MSEYSDDVTAAVKCLAGEPSHDLDEAIAEALWWAFNSDDYLSRMQFLREVWQEYLRRKEASKEVGGLSE